MKKLLLVLPFLMIVTVTYSQKRFNLTFLASPQVAWMTSDSKEVKGDKSFLGFGYGVEGDFFLGNENYSILTGLTVSTAGGSLLYNRSITFDGIQLPIGTKVDYILKYLEIPLAVKMRTKDFNRLRFYAQFGLTNWINIKSRATTSDHSFEKDAIKDEVRLYNIGLNVGAGVEYDLGHGNALTGGIVYSNGFTDVTTNSTINDATTLKVLRIRMGFIF